MTAMSMTMLKQVQGHVHRFLSEAQMEFARAVGTKMPTQPMATYTKNVTFSITTPQDGAREFVFAFSLSEQSSPDGTPTSGYGVVTK